MYFYKSVTVTAKKIRLFGSEQERKGEKQYNCILSKICLN